MQHKYGKPLHRSTTWRRNKRFDFSGNLSRRGRKWVSDRQAKGFLGFAATVISLLNKNGEVGYGEIFVTEESFQNGSNLGYWRDKTTDLTFRKLADSCFHPAMIAVAVCSIAKLNKQTRRGAKPVRLLPDQQAFKRLKESGKEMSQDNFANELKRVKLEKILRKSRYKKPEIAQQLNEAEANGFKDDWVLELLRYYETPADSRAHGTTPIVAACKEVKIDEIAEKDVAIPTAIIRKATPPHQIDYLYGASMTRQMASHWRNNPKYSDCLRLLRSLIKKARPKLPSEKYFQMPRDYYLESEIKTVGKIRQSERENLK